MPARRLSEWCSVSSCTTWCRHYAASTAAHSAHDEQLLWRAEAGGWKRTPIAHFRPSVLTCACGRVLARKASGTPPFGSSSVIRRPASLGAVTHPPRRLPAEARAEHARRVVCVGLCSHGALHLWLRPCRHASQTPASHSRPECRGGPPLELARRPTCLAASPHALACGATRSGCHRRMPFASTPRSRAQARSRSHHAMPRRPARLGAGERPGGALCGIVPPGSGPTTMTARRPPGGAQEAPGAGTEPIGPSHPPGAASRPPARLAPPR